jgi:hypothetical protein
MAKQFKKGSSVIKLPLENPADALVIRVIRADASFAYCSDGNKYSQSNGRCSGRRVMGKKDIIKLPPFGYTVEEEMERLKNIAIRGQEVALELANYQQQNESLYQAECRREALELFTQHQDSWKKARRIKTPLGTLRLVILQAPGKFCGEVVTSAVTVLVKKAPLSNGNPGYLAYGTVLSSIDSNLYNVPLMRLLTTESEGHTIAEAVGILFGLVFKPVN